MLPEEAESPGGWPRARGGAGGRVCARAPRQLALRAPAPPRLSLRSGSGFPPERMRLRPRPSPARLCGTGGLAEQSSPCAGAARGSWSLFSPGRCFSRCQSSCTQRMGCKCTVLYGEGVTQASRQRAYWGCFQSSKISKNITVRDATGADALAPMRLLPWVKQCHCLESEAVINHR